MLGIKPNTITTRLKRDWTTGQALGLEERTKPIYQGRLTEGEIVFILDEHKKGTTQTRLGEILDIHPSQISRLIKKCKSNEEKKK